MHLKAKKSRIPKEERIFRVFKKLINYKYKTDVDKPPKLKKIEQEATRKGKMRILTPENTYRNGWVIIEHIEGKKCPYSKETANSKRYDFLNSPYIERDKLIYLNKYGKKKSETVYRLNPDLKTANAVFNKFYGNKAIWEFIESDYYEDNLRNKKGFDMMLMEYLKRVDKGKLKWPKGTSIVDTAWRVQYIANKKPPILSSTMTRALLNVIRSNDFWYLTKLMQVITDNEKLKTFLLHEYLNCEDKEWAANLKEALNQLEKSGKDDKK
jgi:hypothetical protein